MAAALEAVTFGNSPGRGVNRSSLPLDSCLGTATHGPASRVDELEQAVRGKAIQSTTLERRYFGLVHTQDFGSGHLSEPTRLEQSIASWLETRLITKRVPTRAKTILSVCEREIRGAAGS